MVAGCGTERSRLEQEAVRLGICEQVSFLGVLPRDRLIDRMAASDMVLVPSHDEPFGLVALEAAHAGRPVVAAAAGGLVEVVEHDVTGLIFPPKDVGDLASAIRSLLLDPAYADLLGAQARKRAREQYCFEDFVSSTERLLEEMSLCQ